jgi:hypothetical protein
MDAMLRAPYTCPSHPVVMRVRVNQSSTVYSSLHTPCTSARYDETHRHPCSLACKPVRHTLLYPCAAVRSATPFATRADGASDADRHGHCLYAFALLDSTSGNVALISCESGIGLRPIHALFNDCDRTTGRVFTDEDGPGGELAVARCTGGSMHIEGLWELGMPAPAPASVAAPAPAPPGTYLTRAALVCRGGPCVP